MDNSNWRRLINSNFHKQRAMHDVRQCLVWCQDEVSITSLVKQAELASRTWPLHHVCYCAEFGFCRSNCTGVNGVLKFVGGDTGCPTETCPVPCVFLWFTHFRVEFGSSRSNGTSIILTELRGKMWPSHFSRLFKVIGSDTDR